MTKCQANLKKNRRGIRASCESPKDVKKKAKRPYIVICEIIGSVVPDKVYDVICAVVH